MRLWRGVHGVAGISLWDGIWIWDLHRALQAVLLFFPNVIIQLDWAKRTGISMGPFLFESHTHKKQVVPSGKIWLPFERKQWCYEHLVPLAIFHHGWSQVWAPVTDGVGNIVLWDIFTKCGLYVSHKTRPSRGSVHIKQQFFSMCNGGLPRDCGTLCSFLVYFLWDFSFLSAWRECRAGLVIHLPLHVTDCWRCWETHRKSHRKVSHSMHDVGNVSPCKTFIPL